MRAYSIFHPVDGMAEYLYIVLKWQSTPELSSSFAAIHFCTRVPGSLTPNIGQTQATPLPECPSSLRQSLGTANAPVVEFNPFFPPCGGRAPHLVVDIHADARTRCPSIDLNVFAIIAMS
jgi:hypothetical protein